MYQLLWWGGSFLATGQFCNGFKSIDRLKLEELLPQQCSDKEKKWNSLKRMKLQ
jgi:hypothetical protein